MNAPQTTSSEMALNAQRIDFRSQINGRDYRLFVSVPATPPPESGHPVVYLIDGNLHFGIAVDTARIQGAWPDVRKPVIVGIGYPTDSVAEALKVRNLDLTSPTNADYLSTGWIASMNSRADEFGRIDEYLRVLDEEVKPRVAEVAAIDGADQTLMGHSLGGLTTLHALFRRPASFQQYVAISPSIWWNQRAVLAYEPAFSTEAKAGRVKARLLLSVGADEAKGRWVPELPFSEASMRAMGEDCRMVDNVLELAARLTALEAPHLSVRAVVHDGDDHNMVPPVGIARGIMFSMRRSAAATP
jgi:predicted alpha/beta superfamily hydrolase